MTLRNIYAVLWILWLVSFLAIEFSALGTNHSEYTLSEFVWRVEQLGKAWTVLRFFICAFCLWLFFHMAFGWFR